MITYEFIQETDLSNVRYVTKVLDIDRICLLIPAVTRTRNVTNAKFAVRSSRVPYNRDSMGSFIPGKNLSYVTFVVKVLEHRDISKNMPAFMRRKVLLNAKYVTDPLNTRRV